MWITVHSHSIIAFNILKRAKALLSNTKPTTLPENKEHPHYGHFIQYGAAGGATDLT